VLAQCFKGVLGEKFATAKERKTHSKKPRHAFGIVTAPQVATPNCLKKPVFSCSLTSVPFREEMRTHLAILVGAVGCIGKMKLLKAPLIQRVEAEKGHARISVGFIEIVHVEHSGYESKKQRTHLSPLRETERKGEQAGPPRRLPE
jgi:hypothetical protein